MLQMIREGMPSGKLVNSTDFMTEFGVSRRTVARDLDFLRDEERAPLAYDDARHGFRLTDETYTLPPVRISRKEAFSFGLAHRLFLGGVAQGRARWLNAPPVFRRLGPSRPTFLARGEEGFDDLLCFVPLAAEGLHHYGIYEDIDIILAREVRA